MDLSTLNSLGQSGPDPSALLGTALIVTLALISAYQAVSKLLHRPPPKNPELITRAEFYQHLDSRLSPINHKIDTIANTLADLNATVARIDERTKHPN